MKEFGLNDSQLGVYLDMLEDMATTKYNILLLLRLPEGVDRGRVWKAFVDSVAAHPVYAATFAAGENGPVMRIPDDGTLKLTPCSPDEFVKPFDLERGPLVRAALVDDGLKYEMHHLVSDGSSSLNLCSEIAARYAGRDPEPEELTIFDKVEEDAKAKATPAYAEAKAWFENRFGGSECECGVERDAETDDVGSALCERTVLDAELSVDKIASWTRANGVTPNTLMMAAFGYTTAAFAGADEGLFTMGTHGRTDKRYEKAHGMFVRTLPIKVERAKSDDETCLDFMKRVQADFREERKYDFYSFLDLAKDYGISDRFCYVYNAGVWQETVIDGKVCASENLGLLQQPGEFVMMVLLDHKGHYRFSVTYRKSSYRPETVESFLNVFVTVLKGLRAGGKLADLALCDEATLKLLDKNNETEVPYDREKTVVELFREQAKARPDHPCVVHLDTTLTYREVDEQSDRIASFLNAKGIGKGDFVSILIPRCVWMTTASMGVLKSGAAYQPLDPSYPPERLEFMIADAGVKLVIADETLLGRIPGYKGPVVTLKDLEGLGAPGKERQAYDGKGIKPGDAFIILYTSGTTGKPKGAVLEHGNLMAFCAYHRRAIGLDGEARTMAYASYGFDANMMDQYPTLTAGGTIHVIDESIRLDIPAIDAYFVRHGITHAFMTTQVGRAFAQAVTAPSLKWLGVGGEALVPLEPPKGFTLANIYGPTETTVYVTCQNVERLYRHMPIGKVLDNIRAYVVDKRGRRLPPGVPGELWISGPQVSRGYLNNPEKTAAAFGANPFVADCGGRAAADYSRIYRTGDIVKFLSDGTIMFVGRRDGQVKVRGFRIELSEVEEVVRRFPGVKDATVAAFDDPAGGKFVAAYVVGDAKIDVEAMNAFIRAEKPPYMVPAVTMQIEKIPLNQNQKVNKRALPKPERKLVDVKPPENEMQRKIFDLVAQELGHRAFGIDNSFYEVGLTSIGSVRLNVALGKAFKRPVKLADIKANDTVRAFEAFLAGGAETVAYARQGDYPLTKTQMGIVVECQAHPGTTIYNIPMLVKLPAGIDVERLAAACRKALDAHPYVKTHIVRKAGAVRAERRDEALAEVRVVAGPVPEAKALVRPFDLFADDLYRIEIYQVPGGAYLFADFHHIVSDGASEGVFFADVSRAYAGETPEAETYTGYEVALDEEAALKTDRLVQAKAHYDAVFGGCEPDALPPYAQEGLKAGVDVIERKYGLLADDVRRFCDRTGGSANALFNAAFGFALAKYNGRTDIVYTTIYNGRNDSRTANSMAMFVKTLPVLVDLKAGDGNVASLVRRTRDQLMASMANDLYSFADISNAYGIRSDVLFAYQGDAFSVCDFCGGAFETVALPLDTAKATLSLDVWPDGEDYRIVCEYDTGAYSAAFVEGFLESVTAATRAFLAAGGCGATALSAIDMITPGQRAAYDAYNATEKPYDESKTVIGLFRENADRHPDKPALVFLEKRFTYGELDRMTDAIAAELAAKGAGRGKMVGVLVPRNEWMTVLTLAVLKARSGYLPMDASYPDERLNLMLEDSGAVMLLTTDELGSRIGPDFKGVRVTVDELAQFLDRTAGQSNNQAIPPAPTPDDLFVMLYTSGTTGKPKGAVLDHANILAMAVGVIELAKHDENTVCATYGSYGFDSNISDTFPTYAVGGTLHIIPEEKRLDLGWIRDYFNDNQVTHSDMTTQVGRQFAIQGGTKTLKFLCVGGEKLVPLDPPNFRVVNGYGPAECTAYVTNFDVDRRYAEVPIGKPNANVKLYVCDAEGHLLPPNAVGELWIAGPQVCRGYLNRPEKTAEVFVANPFDGGKWSRAYRTGDVVSLRDDGELMFIGRRDGQVKVRGFRIELTEVEEVIRRFPGVKDATVAAFDNPSGNGKFVAAYVVGDAKIDIEAMNAFIRAEKPPYMVPAVTMQIDKIPLNQNQKVNKRALPKPELKREEYVAPANDVERKFCELFAEALDQERVGATDDFFEIGGSSIVAISLMALANAAGYDISYSDVFECRTPRALAERCAGGKAAEKRESMFDFSVYDHDRFAEILEENTLDALRQGETRPLGDVLVTGATGFMGIHVLTRFLDTETGKAYALVRKGKFDSPKARLRTMLHYYFGGAYDEALETRVTVFDGDVTRPESLEPLFALQVGTVFNCAANVKHFSSGTDIEDVNIGGAKAMIDFCLKTGARLIQFSTVSVGGFVPAGENGQPSRVLDEKTLYVGQNLDNKYTGSKMIGELEVFKAVAERGLSAKVIRVGSLAPREQDGEFQINFRTNSFMGTLRAYALLGKFPYSRLEGAVRMDPIDESALAYLALAKTPEKCRLFHAENIGTIPMVNVICMMRDAGIAIEFVEDDTFDAALDAALADAKNARVLQPMLAYRNMAGDAKLVETPEANSYTTQVLARLGFFWQATSDAYVRAFVDVLRDFDYFDSDAEPEK